MGQAPDTGEDVYLLGHEELQQTALSLISATELSEFRQRLHTWADRYHSQNWPPNSPDYLLRGYPKVLRETGDLRRLISLATSEHRHRCLRKKSGTDLAALTEIESSFDLMANTDGVSATLLRSASQLAFHRDSLHESNRYLPDELFSLWARLGMVERAVNHAFAQDSRDRTIEALLSIGDTMHEMGELDSFLSLINEAYGLTLSVPDPSDQAYHCAAIAHAYIRGKDSSRAARHAQEASDLIASIDPIDADNETHALISRAFAHLGDWDLAASQTEKIVGEEERAHTVASIATIAARLGDLQRSTEITYEIVNKPQRARALAQIAKEFYKAGLPAKASKLIRDAIAASRSIENPNKKAHSLAATGEALIDAEQLDWSAVVTDEAYNVALSAPADKNRTFALSAVAQTFAKARYFGHSAEVVNNMGNDSWQAMTHAYIAEEIASSGDYEKATSVAKEIGDSQQRSRALSAVAKELSKAKRCDDALDLASGIEDQRHRVEAMIEIATEIAKSGDLSRGLRLADEITDLSRSLGQNVADDPWALSDIALALAESASPDDALPVIDRMNKHAETPNLDPTIRNKIIDLASEATAWTSHSEKALEQVRRLKTSHRKAFALAHISSIRARSGDISVADQLADEAVAASRALSKPKVRSTALAAAAQATAEAGQKERALHLAEEAVKIAQALADPETHSVVLAAAAQATAEAGQKERALHLAEEAVKIARSLTDLEVQAHVMTTAAKTFCKIGEFHSARDIVSSLTESDLRAESTFEVVQDLSEIGEFHLAAQLAASLASPDVQAKAQCAIAAEAENARKALVSALRLCRWRDLAWLLGKISPGDLIHIYERLTRESR
ncbi:tetratricopeptide repeat protein [Streptomyces sp. NPDC093089]|uniref:tetratricopeptide repeat protein n=1 Tax=Streptomyces sp. NPDC093089 TaxID=3366024 RepID=UPI00383017D1